MKKLIGLSLVLVLAIFVVASVALADYGKGNSLAGVIKEYKTLRPLSGTTVKLYDSYGRYKRYKNSDTTSLAGKYKFSDLKEGTYTISVVKNGYRNPSDMKKNVVSRVIRVDGNDRKNLYLQRI